MICLPFTFTWASGASAAKNQVVGVDVPDAEGLTHTIFVHGTDTTGGITYTVALKDAYGHTLFSKGTLVDNAEYLYDPDAAENHEFPIGSGSVLTVTPSTDPGASGFTVTAFIYVMKV
jgi:hypothetical protein